MRTLATMSLLLLSSNVWATPTTCTQGLLTRTVEVIYSEPGQSLPCEVFYDKVTEGEQTTLWRAEREAGYCEERADELIVTLSEMDWTCSDAEPPADATEAP